MPPRRCSCCNRMSVSRMTSAHDGRNRESCAQHLVMSRLTASGQEGSIGGRKPLIATCTIICTNHTATSVCLEVETIVTQG